MCSYVHMTLTYILDVDLDDLKCNCTPKIQFLVEGFQKLEPKQDTQTRCCVPVTLSLTLTQ